MASGEMRPVKSPKNSVLQIGAWRVDPALDEISRDGQTTKLEPKLMRLLLCLAAHAGKVVSVEQLLDEVWKDVVVTPDSVYHAVAALRRALGDDSKVPTYIANVMRRGYRLIAPVDSPGIAEALASPPQSPRFAAENQAVTPQSRSIRKLTGRRFVIATITGLAVALTYALVDRFWTSKRYRPNATPTTAAAFTPPPHSIAVLPFVNISGDKEQDYFSDGLTEELLNSLSRINELQVAARTSSFYFKGEHVDLPTIAHKLNVASVLEGSVRRSGGTIRVTAQLNNAITGYHLWSQTYDRDVGDILSLQTDIANAVASALKVTLLGDVATRIEVGGTRNPAAFDAYLRGLKAERGELQEQGLQDAIAGYTEAIRLDRDYALAYATRSLALAGVARNWATGAGIHDYRERARVDARKAITLAPDLADGHLALALILEESLGFEDANREYQRALALAPGDANLLAYYGEFAVQMGQVEAGLAAAHRSVVLDPLNSQNHLSLGISELMARRVDDALLALKHAKALSPDDAGINAWLGYAYYHSGDFQSARRACESADPSNKPICLAMVYNKLRRHADAETVLTRFQADWGDSGALFYAMIYAQWGDTARALDWLETAMRHRDPYLEKLKTGTVFDPLRKEPRFQAIERELKFPN
jgi:TolB-like protein/DNA-binding winged helix-turn-helix (wHTH) protein/Flp pilus assembly protein TadD